MTVFICSSVCLQMQIIGSQCSTMLSSYLVIRTVYYSLVASTSLVLHHCHVELKVHSSVPSLKNLKTALNMLLPFVYSLKKQLLCYSSARMRFQKELDLCISKAGHQLMVFILLIMIVLLLLSGPFLQCSGRDKGQSEGRFIKHHLNEMLNK